MHTVELDKNRVIEDTLNWIRTVVIGLNLCPFAAATLKNNDLPIQVSQHTNPADVATDISHALQLMGNSSEPRTSILVTPSAFPDFLDYNDFLSTVDDLIQAHRLQGVIQVASFHPLYQFSGTTEHDAANFTNRAPYPMFHFLREDDIGTAVNMHPDTLNIPEENIKTCESKGYEAMQKLLDSCYSDTRPNRPTSGE